MKKRPSSTQAADYSATLTYLNAVKAAGTDDGDKIMATMKSTKINDIFATNGQIRPDGRMVHDMFLMQVKTPAESKYPWDYYKLVATAGRSGVRDKGRVEVCLVAVELCVSTEPGVNAGQEPSRSDGEDADLHQRQHIH